MAASNRQKRWVTVALLVALCGTTAGWAVAYPQGQRRRSGRFLDVSVELVGSYTLPKQSFDGEAVGGIFSDRLRT